MSEMAQPETAKTKDTAVVTTRDNARAYTAALVSPGVRSRVAPLPAPRIARAECGMWFPHSAAHRSAREFAPELLGGRLAQLPASSARGRHRFGWDAARTRGAPHEGTAGMR